jgi:DNA repair exonuclease SbcCD ATPase subunit
MKCKDCGCEHPPEYAASPHYCIARLQERIEVLERQLKQIGAEYDRLWQRWEAYDTEVHGLRRQLAESRAEHARALEGMAEVHRRYLVKPVECALEAKGE